VATVSNDVDEIRRQMAAIRRDLHEDVKGVVATAGAATDWRRYLTAYPWVTVGAAFAAGYALVPRRHHKTADALAATQADLTQVRRIVESTGKAVAESIQAPPAPPKERRKSLIGAALGMAAPLVLRAAQGYALKYLEQWIMQQQSATLQAGPPPGRPTYPGSPGSAGGTGPGRPSPGPYRPGGSGSA
jgi:hypothetical protein